MYRIGLNGSSSLAMSMTRTMLRSRPSSVTSVSTSAGRRMLLSNQIRGFSRTIPRLNKPSEQSTSKTASSLKELMKKYGWAAFGVYMTLSALDLPVCFLFVHSMGQERVAEMERTVRGWFGYSTKTEDLKTAPKPQQPPSSEDGEDGAVQKQETNWNLILTELGIAYIIHKSVFIFFRVPATAAITPWAVKTLRRFGFNIGKGTNPAGKAALGQTPKKGQRWWWFF